MTDEDLRLEWLMGFDKNSYGPLVVLRRWTTKVNFGMATAVLIFFALGGLLFWYFVNNHSGTPIDEHVPVPTAEVGK